MGLVIQTIGTAGGRTYSTISAWEAGLPANLVTDGNSYEGDCYNDSEFTAGCTFAAHTTDSTHTILLTTGSGQSFQDNASVRTNALAYNQSNGVGINLSADYSNMFGLSNHAVDFLTISKLQLRNLKAHSGIISANYGASNQKFKDLLIDTTAPNGVMVQISGATVINVLIIVRSSTAGTAFPFDNQAGNNLFIGCSAIRASNYTAGGTAFSRTAGTPIMQSCCSFGYTTASTAGWDGTNSKNNATDQTTVAGVNNQTSVTYTSATPFTGASDAGTLDLRSIAATSLATNGFLDSTNAPNDISATARPASPTIGHWQLSGATTPVGFYPSYPDQLFIPNEVVAYQ